MCVGRDGGVVYVSRVVWLYCGFFFFQAEDGIRDAQESRGLGDVYKRQEPGERSAVFETVSKGAAQTSLKVHFFYINISLGLSLIHI